MKIFLKRIDQLSYVQEIPAPRLPGPGQRRKRLNLFKSRKIFDCGQISEGGCYLYILQTTGSGKKKIFSVKGTEHGMQLTGPRVHSKKKRNAA